MTRHRAAASELLYPPLFVSAPLYAPLPARRQRSGNACSSTERRGRTRFRNNNSSAHARTAQRKGYQVPTPRVKYILSPSEIPLGRNYVLVTYGDQYKQTRHSLGITITVARQKSKTVSELSFLTAVHTARGIGRQEGISDVFACK
jgi:hypothetical protein